MENINHNNIESDEDVSDKAYSIGSGSSSGSGSASASSSASSVESTGTSRIYTSFSAMESSKKKRNVKWKKSISSKSNQIKSNPDLNQRGMNRR